MTIQDPNAKVDRFGNPEVDLTEFRNAVGATDRTAAQDPFEMMYDEQSRVVSDRFGNPTSVIENPLGQEKLDWRDRFSEFEGFWKSAGSFIPYVADALDAHEKYDLYERSVRLQNGTASDEDFRVVVQTLQRMYAPKTFGYQFWDTVLAMPAWMGSMMTGGGLAMKGATAAGEKLAGRWGRQALGDLVADALTDAAGKGAKRKLMAGLAKRGAVGAAITPINEAGAFAAGLAMSPWLGTPEGGRVMARAYEESLERAGIQLAEGEAGELSVMFQDQIPEFMEGVGWALLGEIGETSSEMMGGLAGGALADGAMKVPGIAKVVALQTDFARWFAERVGKVPIARELRKVIQKGQFAGLAGEYVEEKIAGSLDMARRAADPTLEVQPAAVWGGLESEAAMIAALLVPGAAVGAAAAAGKRDLPELPSREGQEPKGSSKPTPAVDPAEVPERAASMALNEKGEVEGGGVVHVDRIDDPIQRGVHEGLRASAAKAGEELVFVSSKSGEPLRQPAMRDPKLGQRVYWDVNQNPASVDKKFYHDVFAHGLEEADTELHDALHQAFMDEGGSRLEQETVEDYAKRLAGGDLKNLDPDTPIGNFVLHVLNNPEVRKSEYVGNMVEQLAPLISLSAGSPVATETMLRIARRDYNLFTKIVDLLKSAANKVLGTSFVTRLDRDLLDVAGMIGAERAAKLPKEFGVSEETVRMALASVEAFSSLQGRKAPGTLEGGTGESPQPEAQGPQGPQPSEATSEPSAAAEAPESAGEAAQGSKATLPKGQRDARRQLRRVEAQRKSIQAKLEEAEEAGDENRAAKLRALVAAKDARARNLRDVLDQPRRERVARELRGAKVRPVRDRQSKAEQVVDDWDEGVERFAARETPDAARIRRSMPTANYLRSLVDGRDKSRLPVYRDIEKAAGKKKGWLSQLLRGAFYPTSENVVLVLDALGTTVTAAERKQALKLASEVDKHAPTKSTDKSAKRYAKRRREERAAKRKAEGREAWEQVDNTIVTIGDGFPLTVDGLNLRIYPYQDIETRGGPIVGFGIKDESGGGPVVVALGFGVQLVQRNGTVTTVYPERHGILESKGQYGKMMGPPLSRVGLGDPPPAYDDWESNDNRFAARDPEARVYVVHEAGLQALAGLDARGGPLSLMHFRASPNEPANLDLSRRTQRARLGRDDVERIIQAAEDILERMRLGGTPPPIHEVPDPKGALERLIRELSPSTDIGDVEVPDRFAAREAIGRILETPAAKSLPEAAQLPFAIERYAARGDTHPKDDDAFMHIVNGGAGKVVPPSFPDSANRLLRDYVEDRIPSFDLVGTRVDHEIDAASLFGALRSPFIERMSYAVEVDGVIEESGIAAIGNSGSVPGLYPRMEGQYGFARAMSAVEKALDRDAKSITLFFAHNHPDGNPEQSKPDETSYAITYDDVATYLFARYLRQQLKRVRLRGLVLNGSKLTVWRPHGTLADTRVGKIMHQGPFGMMELANKLTPTGSSWDLESYTKAPRRYERAGAEADRIRENVLPSGHLDDLAIALAFERLRVDNRDNALVLGIHGLGRIVAVSQINKRDLFSRSLVQRFLETSSAKSLIVGGTFSELDRMALQTIQVHHEVHSVFQFDENGRYRVLAPYREHDTGTSGYTAVQTRNAMVLSSAQPVMDVATDAQALRNSAPDYATLAGHWEGPLVPGASADAMSDAFKRWREPFERFAASQDPTDLVKAFDIADAVKPWRGAYSGDDRAPYSVRPDHAAVSDYLEALATAEDSEARSEAQETLFARYRTALQALPRFGASDASLQRDEAGFYSAVEKALMEGEQKAYRVDQLQPRLLKAGVKPDELEWMGFDEVVERLRRTKGNEKIPVETILDHLDATWFELSETRKGPGWYGGDAGGHYDEDDFDPWDHFDRDEAERQYVSQNEDEIEVRLTNEDEVNEFDAAYDDGDGYYIVDTRYGEVADLPSVYGVFEPHSGSYSTLHAAQRVVDQWVADVEARIEALREEGDEGGADELQSELDEVQDNFEVMYAERPDEDWAFDYNGEEVNDGYSSEEDAQEAAEDWLRESAEELDREELADAVGWDPDDVDDPNADEVGHGSTRHSSYRVSDEGPSENYRELLMQVPRSVTDRQGVHPFVNSGHWNEPNVIGFARMSDRVLLSGERTTFIEEMQSDWHQAGSKRGYMDATLTRWVDITDLEGEIEEGWRVSPVRINNPRQSDGSRQFQDALYDYVDIELPNGALLRKSRYELFSRGVEDPRSWSPGNVPINRVDPERNAAFRLAAYNALRDDLTESDWRSRVPDAPYKETWQNLVLRRLIRDGVRRGDTGLAWATGWQQVKAWGWRSGQAVHSIRWTPDGNGRLLVHVYENERQHKDRVNYAGFHLDTKTWEVKHKDYPQTAFTDYLDKPALDAIQASPNSGEFFFNKHALFRGRGFQTAYDKKLVSAARKIGKKYKASVGRRELLVGEGRRVTIDGHDQASSRARAIRDTSVAANLGFAAFKSASIMETGDRYEMARIAFHDLMIEVRRVEEQLRSGYTSLGSPLTESLKETKRKYIVSRRAAAQWLVDNVERFGFTEPKTETVHYLPYTDKLKDAVMRGDLDMRFAAKDAPEPTNKRKGVTLKARGRRHILGRINVADLLRRLKSVLTDLEARRAREGVKEGLEKDPNVLRGVGFIDEEMIEYLRSNGIPDHVLQGLQVDMRASSLLQEQYDYALSFADRAAAYLNEHRYLDGGWDRDEVMALIQASTFKLTGLGGVPVVPIPAFLRPEERRAQRVKPRRLYAEFALPEEGWFDKFLRAMQDRELRLLRFDEAEAQATGQPVRAEDSAYRAAERMPGRIGAAAARLRRRFVLPIADEVEAAAERGVMIESQGEDPYADGYVVGVSEYLEARHAPERNDWHAAINPDFVDVEENPGSGLATSTANHLVRLAEQGPAGDQLRRIGELWDQMNRERLDLAVEAGLVSPEVRDDLNERWQHYAPLRTNVAGRTGGFPSGGTRHGVRGYEWHRTQGRTTRADNVLGTGIAQAFRTIVRAEKNRVGRTFHDQLVEVFEKGQTPDAAALAKAPDGKVPLDYEVVTEEASEDPLEVIADLREEEEAKRRPLEDDEYRYYRGGAPVIIRLSDPLIARALNGVGGQGLLGREDSVGTILRGLKRIMRALAAVNTSLSLTFMLRNVLRDAFQGGVTAAGEHSAALAQRVLLDVGSGGAIRGMWEALGDSEEVKTEWGQWGRRMMDAGGKVDYFYAKTPEEIEASMQSAIARAQGGTWEQVKHAVNVAGDLVDRANGAVENGIRVAVFRRIQEERYGGLSAAEAARVSKNLTLNFNRKGELSDLFGGLYLFFNPAVQGTHRAIKAMSVPGVQKVLGGMVGASFALTLYNLAVGGDGEDGLPRYLQIPEWERDHHLILMKPGGGTFFKLPLPYFFNVAHVIGERAALATQDHTSIGGIAADTVATLIRSANPWSDDASLSQMVTPTLLDPIVQIDSNENFAGNPIRPQQPQFGAEKPASELYFQSVSPGLKRFARWLNRVTGGDEVIEGAVSVSPEDLEHLIDFAVGSMGRDLTQFIELPSRVSQTIGQDEPFNWSKVPVARGILGEPAPWYTRRAYYEHRDELELMDTHLKAAREAGDADKVRELSVRYREFLPLIDAFDTADKALRKMRDAALGGDEARAKAMDKRIDEHMTRLNRAFNEARDRAREAD